MKKALTLTLLVAILLAACVKEPHKDVEVKPSTNSIVELSDGDKKDRSIFLLTTRVGHNSSDCNGSCVTYNGQTGHVDCMGQGNLCEVAANVNLQQVGAAISITTTDTFNLTSGNFFLMPNRSLDYMDQSGLHTYLNIPTQLVYRDTTTLQFTFTGLFFSSKPAYSNQ